MLGQHHPSVDTCFFDAEIIIFGLISLRIQSFEYLEVYLFLGIVFEHANSKLLMSHSLMSVIDELIAKKTQNFRLSAITKVLPYLRFNLINR